MTDPYPPSPLPAHGPVLILVQRISMAAFGSAEAQEWLEETDSEGDSEEDEDSSEDSDPETVGKCSLGAWFTRHVPLWSWTYPNSHFSASFLRAPAWGHTGPVSGSSTCVQTRLAAVSFSLLEVLFCYLKRLDLDP